jgi:hypothetical protein
MSLGAPVCVIAIAAHERRNPQARRETFGADVVALNIEVPSCLNFGRQRVRYRRAWRRLRSRSRPSETFLSPKYGHRANDHALH